jgi:hypothetical protein
MQCAASIALKVVVAVSLLIMAQTGVGAEPRRLQISHSVIEHIAASETVDVLVLLDDTAERDAVAPVLPFSLHPSELRGADYGR